MFASIKAYALAAVAGLVALLALLLQRQKAKTAEAESKVVQYKVEAVAQEAISGIKENTANKVTGVKNANRRGRKRKQFEQGLQ